MIMHFRYSFADSDMLSKILISMANSYLIQQQFMIGMAHDGVSRKYFARDSEGEVFLLVTASGQMTIDQAIRLICNFRNAQLKKEFTETEDLSPFKLFPFNDEVKAEFGEATTEDRSLLQQLKDSAHLAIDSTPEEGYSLLRTGLMKKTSTSIKEVKIVWIAKSKEAVKPESIQKTEYLRQLIIRIIDIFFKEIDEDTVDKIICYGAIDPVITHPLFATDLNFRERFKNILYNCKTFKQLKLYRGEDIELRRAELVDALTECLIQLDINEEAAEAILNELVKRPLQNIVANRTDLTNQQKSAFYRSEFYGSGILSKYAQILNYQQSLEFKAKEEIGEILKTIEDLGRITRQIVDCLLNFRLFALLQITSIRHIKRNIFDFIFQNCPNYLKAFKLAKYQGKKPSSFAEKEGDCLMMELITVFQNIRLPSDEWQLAQDKIMSRNYSVLDELTLKLKEKHDLMQHIMAKIEPYFHRQEKEMGYRSEIELVLLQAIMATNISDANFDTILTIIDQTLDSQDCSSESIKDLPRREQTVYQGLMAKPIFRDYVANKGRDVGEEQYTKRWELKKQIFENNLQDKIDVTYEAIDELIQKVVQEDSKIPKTFHKYVTDLAKLRGDPIQLVEEEIPEESLPQQESVQEPTIKFNEASQKLYKTYINQFPDSLLANCLDTKFGKNTPNLVRKMIDSNVFTDENTKFFSDLGYNPLLTKRFRVEISAKVAIITSEIRECTSLIKKLPPQSSTSNISLENSVPLAAFKTKCDALVEKYKSLNEESMLDRVLKEKYDKDCTRLMQDLKVYKAFGNPESAFFSKLGLSQLLTRRIKREFANNAEWALKELEALH